MTGAGNLAFQSGRPGDGYGRGFGDSSGGGPLFMNEKYFSTLRTRAHHQILRLAPLIMARCFLCTDPQDLRCQIIQARIEL